MSEPIFTPTDGKLTIVLDRTRSMGGVINTIKSFLPKYIIRRAGMGIESLCLVTFDDHYSDPEDYPGVGNTLDVYGPTDNLEEFMYWLHQVRIGHGGDNAEAIACALHAARATHPGASIWLVTDAAPHGYSKTANISPLLDSFPCGCPCGIDLDITGVSVLYARENVIPGVFKFWGNSVGERFLVMRDLADSLNQDPINEPMLAFV